MSLRGDTGPDGALEAEGVANLFKSVRSASCPPLSPYLLFSCFLLQAPSAALRPGFAAPRLRGLATASRMRSRLGKLYQAMAASHNSRQQLLCSGPFPCQFSVFVSYSMLPFCCQVSVFVSSSLPLLSGECLCKFSLSIPSSEFQVQSRLPSRSRYSFPATARHDPAANSLSWRGRCD